MDKIQIYYAIHADEDYRKLAADPDFQVILDFSGHFFRAMLGNADGDFGAQRRVRTLDAAIEWLKSEVLRTYPRSRYARSLGTAATPGRQPSEESLLASRWPDRRKTERQEHLTHA